MATKVKPPSSLAIVLFIIGLASCAFLTFLGLIYLFNGSTLFAALFTIPVLVVLPLLTYSLVAMKTRKEAYKPRTPEFILLGLYLTAFIILFPFCFHALKIDALERNEIKATCSKRVEAITELQKEYNQAVTDSLNSLKNRAEALSGQLVKTRATYDSLNLLLGTSTFLQMSKESLEKYIQTAQNGIRQKYEMKDLDETARIFKDEAEVVFSNWEHLQTGLYYERTDSIFTMYKASAIKKMTLFQPQVQLPNDYNLASPISSLKSGPVSAILIVILIMLLIHFAILLPYISAGRQDGGLIIKSPPRETGGEGKISSAEPEIL